MAAEDAALVALEHRVRQRILRSLAGIVSHVAVAISAAAQAAPKATAAELLSRADVHQAITAELARASRTVEAAVRAAYLAGAKLGLVQAKAALHRIGHFSTTKAPDGGDYLAAVVGDIVRAFSQALPDIQRSLTTALDDAAGRGSGPVRKLMSHTALRRVARRLYVRAGAAGSVAVHRGYSDAQQAAWNDYAEVNPYVRLVKTWRVTAADPCASCRALDGVTVGIDQQFDRSLGAPERVLSVYRDLHRPPRHPNCRCRLTYDFAPDPRQAITSFR